MRFSTWIAIIPTALITIWFALANRSLVTLSLDPFNVDEPTWAVRLPLFAIMFVAVFVGMIAGGIVVWWGEGHWRREAQKSRNEARKAADPAAE